MREMGQGRKGDFWSYNAPNPLRGGASSFAKASEDMSKGERGLRGEGRGLKK